MEKINWFLDRTDGIEEASISGMSVFGADCSWLSCNKTFVFEHFDIFADSVYAYSNSFTNGVVTGIALESFPVLAVEEEGVDSNLPRFQSERKNLVWQGKIVFDRVTFLPLLKSQ